MIDPQQSKRGRKKRIGKQAPLPAGPSQVVASAAPMPAGVKPLDMSQQIGALTSLNRLRNLRIRTTGMQQP